MMHPKIDPARHSQGLNAYRGGQTILDLHTTLQQIELMHATAASTEQHDEIAAAGPSLVLGYMDGFLEDFRAVVGALTTRRHSLRA
jgi:hypothetical protein